MRVQTLSIVLAMFAMLAASSVAYAHSRLVTPPSRSDDDTLMEGPCGGVAAGPPTTYEAGSTLTMEWATSQNHFNVFRVAFSPGDDLGFDDNVLGTRPDEEDVFEYVQDVPLPACTCESCTLQLAQFTATGMLAYYSCADIQLTAPEGEAMDPCAAADPEPAGSSTGSDAAESAGDSTTAEGGETGATTSDSAAGTTGDATPGATGVSGGGGGGSDDEQGCRVAPQTAPRGSLLLLLLGLRLAIRRRKTAPRTPRVPRRASA